MGGFIYYAFSTFLPELRSFRFLAPVVNAVIMAGLYHWRYSYFLELVKIGLLTNSKTLLGFANKEAP